MHTYLGFYTALPKIRKLSQTATSYDKIVPLNISCWSKNIKRSHCNKVSTLQQPHTSTFGST